MSLLESFAINELQAFLFDLGGCIYFGDTPAPGAKALLARPAHDEKVVRFITNNSTSTASEIAKNLARMDLVVDPAQIVTATELTGKYLCSRFGHVRVKAFGAPALSCSLRSWGHTLISVHQARRADVIVIGRDVEFTHEKLLSISRDVMEGELVIGTNPDLYHPGHHNRRIPETGALLASVRAVTGLKIPCVGKPSPLLIRVAMAETGIAKELCMIIGDNNHTDIVAGVRSGVRTSWITPEPECVGLANPRADFVFSSILELKERYCA